MTPLSPEERLRAAGVVSILPDAPTFGRLKLLDRGHILAVPSRGYLLKGLLSPNELSIWWGEPKSGKTFLAMRVAYAIARGDHVWGRRVHACPVLYIAAEGQGGLANRFKALEQEVGQAPGFYMVAQQVDLLHPEEGDVQAVIDAAKKVRAGLIVVDTVARALAGGDENSSEAMGGFILNLGKIREATGAHILAVHHGTKNPTATTSRGHGSLEGAADAIIRVERDQDGIRSATVQRAKDDADGAVMGFNLRVVDLGPDEDGDTITTCLAEEADAPAGKRPRLTGTRGRAFHILLDLIAAKGKLLPAVGGFPDGLRGIEETVWREECDSRRLSGAEDKKSRSRAFKRAFEDLLGVQAIATRDGLVWATRETTDGCRGQATRGHP